MSLPPTTANFSSSESPTEIVTVFAVCRIVLLSVSTLTFFAILSPASICLVASYALGAIISPLAEVADAESNLIEAENIKEEFPNKWVLALCPLNVDS